jgi:hypothetical protein
MRRLGKWLMLIGLVPPFIYSVFVFLKAYIPGSYNDVSQEMAAGISRSMSITMIGLLIGLVGLTCWIIGLMRFGSRLRRDESSK